MSRLSAAGGRRRAAVLLWQLALWFGLVADSWSAQPVPEETTQQTPTPEEMVEQAAAAFRDSDIVTAMALLLPPAEAGHVPAQVQLAYYLDYAEQDQEAFRWYRAAAEAGDAEAQFYLAKLYGSGEGTPADHTLALEWYQRAASQGFAPATRVLAIAYEQGGPLTPISFEQAVTWLEAGTAVDDEWSLRRLSDAYRRGELGLRIDRARADALKTTAERLANRNE